MDMSRNTGNVFEASAILTSTPNVLVPYTVDELTIHVPYAMTLSPNTLSTGDYRITFGTLHPPSAISIVDLSGAALPARSLMLGGDLGIMM